MSENYYAPYKCFLNKTAYTTFVSLLPTHTTHAPLNFQLQPGEFRWIDRENITWHGIELTAVDDHGATISSNTQLILRDDSYFHKVLNASSAAYVVNIVLAKERAFLLKMAPVNERVNDSQRNTYYYQKPEPPHVHNDLQVFFHPINGDQDLLYSLPLWAVIKWEDNVNAGSITFQDTKEQPKDFKSTLSSSNNARIVFLELFLDGKPWPFSRDIT